MLIEVKILGNLLALFAMLKATYVLHVKQINHYRNIHK